VPQRLVVVGGGTGGTLTANLLGAKLRDKVRSGDANVTLIGDGFRHYFQPANLDIAFKGSRPDSHDRDETSLLRKQVSFIPDPAAKIDLAKRTVTTSSGASYEYDYVVIATGADAAPETIPGLKEGSLNFHTGPQNAGRIWEAVRSFRKGRIGVLIAGVPHKCPPSPDEALFMLDEYFRNRGIRSDVELSLVTPYPRPYPAAKIADVVEPLFTDRGIKTVPFFNLESVDPGAKKAYSLEGDEFGYDLLIAVPPHRGAKVIRDSGFGDEEGWVPADRGNMRVKGYDDAYVIGDATDIPVSKSGVVAHLESKVAAMNVLADIDGSTMENEYNGRINCPMEVGSRRAIFVSATYKDPPSDQAPSLVKYAMKRGFGAIYWSALSGSWEWMMDAYFGHTSEPSSKAGAAIKA
jgi:sulfide:quinone oxidoreductase